MMLKTISDLINKNFPKYDVMIKRSFSMEGSGLRKLLGVPDGRRMPEQLGGLSMLAVDSLTEKNGNFYHVEFQSRNDTSMPWRMLVYYTALVEDHLGRQLYDGRCVHQIVLYLGNDPLRMKSRIRQDQLHFEFVLRDIRDFDAHSNTLLDSKNPHDWITGVLCKKMINDEEWRRIARNIAKISRRGEWDLREIPGLFLIAARLRRLPRNIYQEIVAMLQVNVEDGSVLQAIYDEASASAYRLSIKAMLTKENIQVDDAIERVLADLSEQQLEDLVRRVGAGADLSLELTNMANPKI